MRSTSARATCTSSRGATLRRAHAHRRRARTTCTRCPKVVHAPIVSRIKTLARLDIAEKRRPQDGRIKTARGDREVEMRVSTIAVAFGEKLVIRLFDPGALLQDLPDLGFVRGRSSQVAEKFLARPHGLILVTGPTGSGKTTTLYGALRALATPEVNVVTIEDPIEIVVEAFNQISVQPKIGVGFAEALRHVLRQDPDVIMVGEVRDERDRRDRAAGRAHRPHGARHAAHQRRGERHHAPARARRRPVRPRVDARRRRSRSASCGPCAHRAASRRS